MVAAVRPPADSSLPARPNPPARAMSDALNSVAAQAPDAACTSPTRCWWRCSADQSARPVAVAGREPAMPAAISVRDARSVPGNRSSRAADVQQPNGSRTRAGCAGWPNGTPCRASARGPGGSARTTPVDSDRTAASRAVARSMRSATSTGRGNGKRRRGLSSGTCFTWLPRANNLDRGRLTSDAYPLRGPVYLAESRRPARASGRWARAQLRGPLRGRGQQDAAAHGVGDEIAGVLAQFRRAVLDQP